MAANPPLIQGPGNELFPAPYAGELIGLSRPGIDLSLTGVRTRSGKWTARGTAFLTNMRLVFVAKKLDPESNLQAFELPLAYITQENFNQPIFGANNLVGKCYLVESGVGGEAVDWTLYFKEGGCGTFIPLFYRDVAYIHSVAERQQQEAAAAVPPPSLEPAPSFTTSLSTALVDPSDPTVVYLTQPVAPQPAAAAPGWAAKSLAAFAAVAK
eukprot:scaffold21.g2137.t1